MARRRNSPNFRDEQGDMSILYRVILLVTGSWHTSSEPLDRGFFPFVETTSTSEPQNQPTPEATRDTHRRSVRKGLEPFETYS